MSARAMAAVWDDSKTNSKSEMLVLLALADEADSFGRVADVDLEQIARKAQTVAPLVYEALVRLETCGDIRFVSRQMEPFPTTEVKINVQLLAAGLQR